MRWHAHSEKEKPHRAVGSPALCGLKLLCEFSQARAGNRNRKTGRSTSEKLAVQQKPKKKKKGQHRYSLDKIIQTALHPEAVNGCWLSTGNVSNML